MANFTAGGNKTAVLTVSQLNQRARQLLESGLGQVWLTGELSNFAAPASGHWYFSLKDNSAQVRGAMFRGNNRFVRFRPTSGDQVLIRARVSLYEPRGDYQLIVESMEPAGDGLLRQQFEQLKQQLASEGLFDAGRKQPIPETIQRVGVVTSATGAALRDILHVLARRSPQTEVIVYPSSVQGEQAPGELRTAIGQAIARSEVDVLLIARGGGSLEDLWAFNDETLARVISACPIPVISGVGHEVDTTICDYVADMRAPTPSAAAELVSTDSSQLGQQLADQKQRLHQSLLRLVQTKHQQWRQLDSRLQQQAPTRKLESQFQRLDELTERLHQASQRGLEQRQQRLGAWRDRLASQLPTAQINQQKTRLSQAEQRLHQAMRVLQSQSAQRLGAVAAQLNAVSPLATLGRGYSITQNAKGKVITKVSQVKPGDGLTVRVSDGEFAARVE